MSPIGRIFIVLNLILSAAFLGWAANALATTEDYKTQLAAERDAHATTLANKTKEIEDLNIRINALDEEKRGIRELRDQYEVEKTNLASQLAEANRANDSMQGNLTEIRSTLAQYDETIRQLSTQWAEAVDQRVTAENERDDAVEAEIAAEQTQRDAEEAKAAADTQIADLEAVRTDLQDQVSQLDTRLAMIMEITDVTWQDLIATPKIDAQVLDARMDLAPGLVLLNVGKDKEVKRGYTFEISRGNQYKGQVRVADVQDNVCSALVLNTVEGTTIQQGDDASTVL